MQIGRNVLLALGSLAGAIGALAFRASGAGMYQTAGMHCAAMLPQAAALLLAAALGAIGLAVAAMALEALRRRRIPGFNAMEMGTVGTQVGAPAVLAILVALAAIKPSICI